MSSVLYVIKHILANNTKLIWQEWKITLTLWSETRERYTDE